MSDELSGTGNAIMMANQLQSIYDDFTKAVADLGKKGMDGKKNMSKMGEGALKWIVGSRFRSERDLLSERFAEDVENHLKTFDVVLQETEADEASKACTIVAETLTVTVPAESNSTTDLMKRAMISYLPTYLPMLSREELLKIKDRIESAYLKRQRLPKEKEVLQQIDELLKN